MILRMFASTGSRSGDSNSRRLVSQRLRFSLRNALLEKCPCAQFRPLFAPALPDGVQFFFEGMSTEAVLGLEFFNCLQQTPGPPREREANSNGN
jgi:hypothetical protein